MWDMINAMFWFGLGMVCLASIYVRSNAIADRFDEGKFHNGL